MEVKSLLKKFDFSDKEVDVYLAMLQLGPAVASDIAKGAGINRSTTYVILEMLSNRKVVTSSERRGVKMYNPLSPDQLAKHFASVAKQYSELADEAKRILPKLKIETRKEEAMPKISFFQGDQGIKSVYEDALGSLETIRTFATGEQSLKAKTNYQEVLAKKNIKVRLLSSAKGDLQATEGKGSSVLYGLAPEISVYDNKIVFVSAKDKSALIIENEEFAKALKRAFDASWADKKNPGTSPALGRA